MNGYCRNDYLCPFAHGPADLHRIIVKSSYQQGYGHGHGQVEPDYAVNAGQFLSSILKSLEQVFTEADADKK